MQKNDKEIVKVFNHIEMVLNDVEAVATFMHDHFGAVQVEKQFSSYLENAFNCRVIHMMFGGIVYQLIEPSEPMTSWKNMLEARGSTIHNISVQVNEAEKLVEKLVEAGGKLLLAFEAEMKDAGFDQEGISKGFLIDLTKQCGFIIEVTDLIPAYRPGEQD